MNERVGRCQIVCGVVTTVAGRVFAVAVVVKKVVAWCRGEFGCGWGCRVTAATAAEYFVFCLLDGTSGHIYYSDIFSIHMYVNIYI